MGSLVRNEEVRRAGGGLKPRNLTGEGTGRMDERYAAGALRRAGRAARAGSGVLWAGRPGGRGLPGWRMARASVRLVATAWRFGSIRMDGPYRLQDARQWLFLAAFAAPFVLILGF